MQQRARQLEGLRVALPGQARWSTLERFATEGGAREDAHLVYLVAGGAYRAAEDEAGARLLRNFAKGNL